MKNYAGRSARSMRLPAALPPVLHSERWRPSALPPITVLVAVVQCFSPSGSLQATPRCRSATRRSRRRPRSVKRRYPPHAEVMRIGRASSKSSITLPRHHASAHRSPVAGARADGYLKARSGRHLAIIVHARPKPGPLRSMPRSGPANSAGAGAGIDQARAGIEDQGTRLRWSSPKPT